MLKRGELFALWMAVAVPVVYFSAPADAVNCYHGTVTSGADDDMITDRQFWLENAGDDRAGQPVNCSKRVGAAFDTCSVFCRHYIMLSSEEPMVNCRRFCQTFQGCNTSRFQEDADCEAIKRIPMGNTMLISCTQKCSQGRNSNFEATCTKKSPGYCDQSVILTGGASSFRQRDTRGAALLAGGLAAFLVLHKGAHHL